MNLSEPGEITHATAYENYTGSDATLTKSMALQKQVTSTVTVSLSGAGDVRASVIGKLGIELGGTYQREGAKTSSATQSTTWTMKKGGVTVFYGGTWLGRGTWVYSKCLSNSNLVESKGSVSAWEAYREGGVFCPLSVPSTTLAHEAKRYYC